MDRKHRAEQELLVTIVMDEGSEDLQDAARKMGKEGRQQRLLGLRSKAEKLNLEKKGRSHTVKEKHNEYELF